MIVDITANHQGHFEFKICANNNIFKDPDQSCFDMRPALWTGGGDPTFDNRHVLYNNSLVFSIMYYISHTKSNFFIIR